MLFVGVDQSLNASGICVLTSDGAVQTLLTVEHKEGGAIDVKLLSIRRAVISAISGCSFGAMEGYAYDSVHRAFDLGEVAGTVKVAMLEHQVGYVVVPPVTLKLYATGLSHASKDDMVAAAKAEGVDPSNDNEADAFFLARVARDFAQGTAKKRREMEAIHSLKLSASGKQRKHTRRTRRVIKNAL